MVNRKRAFVAVLTALLLAGFLATSLISYFVAKDSIARNLKEQMLPLTSDNIYSEIQRDLLQPLLISSLMANDAFVVEWARGGEEDPQRMTNYLARIRKKYNTITAFYVSDATQRYYHPDGVIKTLNADDPADAWYFRVRQHNSDYEINVDRDTADASRISIFVNYRVHDQAGRFLGATGVGLAVTKVAELIESYQKRYGREIYFVNRQGDVTLRGSGFDAQNLQDKEGLGRLFTRILTSPSASVSYHTAHGNTVYLNSRLVPEFDWFLIVEQVNDPASDRIEAALVLNMAIALGVSLLVLVVAYFTLGGYQRRLERMATRDKLTGMISRQVFDSIFARAAKAAERKEQPLSLISMDIDHFKRINDTYGHQTGDEVIRTIAALVMQKVRDADTLCRWGGEEFVLLLKNCDLARAAAIAESIREVVKAHNFNLNGDSQTLTISLGVAEWQRGEPQEQLLERCDQALYRSKREGRDCVSLA